MLFVPDHIRGLIFDCDGTLVDSMPLHWTCWHDTFAAFGVSCPHDFLEDLKGVPTDGILRRYNDRFGTSIDVWAFTEEKEKRARELLLTVQPIRLVTDVVDRYHGILPMAVASGGPSATVTLSLRVVGLLDRFVTVVTADDPVKPKPSPDIFLEAARRIGIPPEFCQVFEDADMGIQAAHEAGMIATDVRHYL
ncbi:MAG: HAD-IA family hydrolase [Rhodothermales bacterium]|nr:HAD-IA family hydrolase [Rhodothermales bacterium]